MSDRLEEHKGCPLKAVTEVIVDVHCKLDGLAIEIDWNGEEMLEHRPIELECQDHGTIWSVAEEGLTW